jgi:hypothetical protein
MAAHAHHARQIPEEAAMAATDFNTAQQEQEQEQVRPAYPFGHMDPGVVSEAIPAFFIGRNRSGFWVARESKGQIGGLFLLERSALAFTHAHGEPAGCATIFPTERFELDLENAGNPFARQLAPLLRRCSSLSRFIGKLVSALTPRATDCHVQ